MSKGADLRESQAGQSVRRMEGTFRVFAADDGDFARIVAKATSGGAFTLPHPTPPPVGTRLKLEALVRSTRMRICMADVLVAKAITTDDPKGNAVELLTVRVEPGCPENVRHVLMRSRAPKEAPTVDLGPVVGIDLGTTYTCAAIVEDGVPKVIRSRLGYNTIPSVVTFDDEGRPVIGQLAERRIVLEPESVVHGSKRIIGRTYSKGLVSQLADHMRYGIVADDEGMVAIKLNDRIISPIEVAACVLAEIRRVAEDELRKPIRRVVITVPAAFTENQREAVREAADRAGLELIRMVNEPTAAALAFGYAGGAPEARKVLVYDLGGGTFDVSILEVHGNTYNVLATAGDMFLGGVDFDRIVAALIEQNVKLQAGEGVTLDRRSQERVLAASRDAKHALSELPRATVTIPHLRIEGGKAQSIEFTCTIAREDFEVKAMRLVDRTMKTCERALEIAGMEPKDIDDILLVGGQTRMPIVAQRVQTMFNKRPSKKVHPDEVVAMGAAILATVYAQEKAPKLNDVLPLPIGIAQTSKGAEGIVKEVLPRNTRLPASVSFEIEVPPGKPLEIAVFQGEALRAADCEFLGTFKCSPAEGATAPEHIAVTFSLSSECILSVKTKLPSTGDETEHELTTANTPDEVLERLGKERVVISGLGIKLPPNAPEREKTAPKLQPVVAGPAPAAPPPSTSAAGPAPAPAPKLGFFGSLLKKLTGR